MKPSLLKQVLAEDFDKLAPIIQKHYEVTTTGKTHCVVRGKMSIDYPFFITPLLKIISLFGD